MPNLLSALHTWLLYVLLGLSTATLSANLQAQTPVLTFNPVVTSGLTSPIDLVHASDSSNRIFIVQRGGRIRYMRNGVLTDTVFLNISRIVSTDGERGLLSMAFHPDYAVNGYFFLYYTALGGDVTIARYRVSADANLADSTSGQVLLSINHREFNNHNGGKLNFGNDGNLYFAVGDGGSGNDPHFNAQNGNSLLGKMMRINVDNFNTSPYYSIPADNPYLVQNDNIRDEIWALGLRNPFRWSFDRLTGDMWIGDVGQNAREEIDFRPAGNTGGVNFGWRCYEGNRSNIDSGCRTAGNYIFPVFDYDRTNTNGGQSVTGGFVYRGSAFPVLYGWYVCIDYFSTNAWVVKPSGNSWIIQKQSGLPTGIVGFGEDDKGELYATALTGTIFRVQSQTLLPMALLYFKAISGSSADELWWKMAEGVHPAFFDVQSSTNGTFFRTIATLQATQAAADEYHFSNPVTMDNGMLYRLKTTDNAGHITYSAIIKVAHRMGRPAAITATLITGGKLILQLNKPFNSLQLSDMSGKLLKTANLAPGAGTVSINVSNFSGGMYLIRLKGEQMEWHQKVMIR